MGFSGATLVSGSAIEAIELTALIEMESEMLVFVGKLKDLEMPSLFSFYISQWVSAKFIRTGTHGQGG